MMIDTRFLLNPNADPKTMSYNSGKRWISPEDEHLVMLFYEGLFPNKSGRPTSTEEFVGKLRWRLFTEWCCSPTEGSADEYKYHPFKNTHPSSYECEAFTKWIDDETLYALQRTGSDDYGLVRHRVIGAAVKRAIEVFTEWNGDMPPYDKTGSRCLDDRNVRCDLRPYLGD